MNRLYILLYLCCNGLFINITGDSSPGVKVIYGNDDRKDIYHFPSNTKEYFAIDATVSLIPKTSFYRHFDGSYSLAPSIGSLAHDYNVCSDESFAYQKSASYCSANSSWSVGTLRFTAEDVYECFEIHSPPASVREKEDFGVVRLTRSPYPHHIPVEFRKVEVLAADPLLLVGYPSGLPMKLDKGGEVCDAHQGDTYFEATVDAFRGNSGSGVYVLRNGVYFIAGILVRGAIDYVKDGNCFRVNVMPNTCALGYGEDVLKMNVVVDFLSKQKSASYIPSSVPTATPTLHPTREPSMTPSASQIPTSLPSSVPSASPTLLPSSVPSDSPTLLPTCTPSVHPTSSPSFSPSRLPSASPTYTSYTVATLAGAVRVDVVSVNPLVLESMGRAMEEGVGRECTANMTTRESAKSIVWRGGHRQLDMAIHFIFSLILEDNTDLHRDTFFTVISAEVIALVSSGTLQNITNSKLKNLAGIYTPVSILSVEMDSNSVRFVEVGRENPLDIKGPCPDKTVAKCIENIEDTDGDWSICDMCLCDKYESYGGSGSCGADEELYNCYISDTACKTHMRLPWIIAFISVAIVCCLSVCTLVYWLRRNRRIQWCGEESMPSFSCH